MQLHWIATFFDPSFRELSFVTDKPYRLIQLKAIENGLYSMADDVKLEDIQKLANVSEVIFIAKDNKCNLLYKNRLVNLQKMNVLVKKVIMIHFLVFVQKIL
jgi:hypothetical protein